MKSTILFGLSILTLAATGYADEPRSNEDCVYSVNVNIYRARSEKTESTGPNALVQKEKQGFYEIAQKKILELAAEKKFGACERFVSHYEKACRECGAKEMKTGNRHCNVECNGELYKELVGTPPRRSHADFERGYKKGLAACGKNKTTGNSWTPDQDKRSLESGQKIEGNLTEDEVKKPGSTH